MKEDKVKIEKENKHNLIGIVKSLYKEAHRDVVNMLASAALLCLIGFSIPKIYSDFMLYREKINPVLGKSRVYVKHMNSDNIPDLVINELYYVNFNDNNVIYFGKKIGSEIRYFTLGELQKMKSNKENIDR